MRRKSEILSHVKKLYSIWRMSDARALCEPLAQVNGFA